MNTAEAPSPEPGMRRSHKVALVLLGTAGVVGLATTWDAWRRASRPDSAAEGTPAVEPVSSERVYSNNQFVPGVGYYHAPFHAFYPHPFNHHDPQRGYFAGGLWQAAPLVAALTQSRPSPEAATSAVAAQRAREEQRRTGGAAGFASSGHRGPSGVVPSPATPPSSRPSVIRGGFGSSGRSGVT